MASLPNRLFPDTPLEQNLALINDNFEKAVQDIGDLGARFSSVASFSAFVPAGLLLTQTIGLTDSTNRYVQGSLQIVPRVDVFEDNDADDTYLVGYSNSQSATALVSVYVQRRPSGSNIADFTISILNTDAIAHTYYVYGQNSYVDSPPEGNFR